MKWLKYSYTRKYEIDIERFPCVVIESDDWGALAGVADESLLQEYFNLCGSKRKCCPKLESKEELYNLFSLLKRYHGADGFSPVITAFTCMGNPDFDRIREDGFQNYSDIGVDEGFPAGWNGEGVVAAWQEGIRQDLWHPEFHATLHHINSRRWVELLREEGAAGDFARQMFGIKTYSLPYHLPEYEGFDLPEQERMIRKAFQRFYNLFGRYPSVAINSDATPETVQLWYENGIRTLALLNSRLNNGVCTVYHTKPWNCQDIYGRLGDTDKSRDLAFLTRNVFWEAESPDTAETIWQICCNNFNIYKEPSIISAHRNVWSAYPASEVENNLKRWGEFLCLAEKYGVYFLTSAELGDLYRQGWSLRQTSKGKLLRKWSVCPVPPMITGAVTELPTGKQVVLTDSSQGNYLFAL